MICVWKIGARDMKRRSSHYSCVADPGIIRYERDCSVLAAYAVLRLQPCLLTMRV